VRIAFSIHITIDIHPLDTLSLAVALGSVLDGGTGEELLAHRNVPDDRTTWSARAVTNATFHDTLRLVHTDFLNAGSEYITVNNFALTPGVFGNAPDSIALLKKLTRLAASIARKAADDANEYNNDPNNEQTRKKVLASLPPLVESYRPDLAMTDHRACVALYRSLVVDVLDDLVDGYLAETLSSSAEAIDAMDAVADVQGDKLLFVSMCVKGGGLVRSGERARDAVRAVVQHWIDAEKERSSTSETQTTTTHGLQAVMFNCSTPEDILAALEDVHKDEGLLELLDDAGVGLGAYPNRLTPIKDDWSMDASEAPQATRTDFGTREFVEWTTRVMRTYPRARVVGGCCGIRPDDIRSLSLSGAVQGRER